MKHLTPDELITLWFYCVPGSGLLAVYLMALAHGHVKLRWKPIATGLVFCCFAVTVGSSQSRTWAQEIQRENEQRLKGLEEKVQKLRNQFDVHEAVANEGKAIATRERQQNEDRIASIELRVKDNERFRDRIEWSAPLLATGSSFFVLLIWEILKARPWRRFNGYGKMHNGGMGK